MNEKELLEKIEEIIKDFFERAGSEVEIKKISLSQDNGRKVLTINLKLKKPIFLLANKD